LKHEARAAAEKELRRICVQQKLDFDKLTKQSAEDWMEVYGNGFEAGYKLGLMRGLMSDKAVLAQNAIDQ
jgi:hypothetical protein